MRNLFDGHLQLETFLFGTSPAGRLHTETNTLPNPLNVLIWKVLPFPGKLGAVKVSPGAVIPYQEGVCSIFSFPGAFTGNLEYFGGDPVGYAGLLSEFGSPELAFRCEPD